MVLSVIMIISINTSHRVRTDQFSINEQTMFLSFIFRNTNQMLLCIINTILILNNPSSVHSCMSFRRSHRYVIDNKVIVM